MNVNQNVTQIDELQIIGPRDKSCRRLDCIRLLHTFYQLSHALPSDGARLCFLAIQPPVPTGWLALLLTKAEDVKAWLS